MAHLQRPESSSIRRIELALSIVGAESTVHDVRIAAASDSTWAEVRTAMTSSGCPVPSQVWIGRDELTDDFLVGHIAHGSVLSFRPTAATPHGLLALECIHGPQVGARRWLDRRPLTIGRVEPAVFPLDDPDVSRLHCAVALDAGRVTVHDLDSTNGTQIGGRKIGAVELGSELRVGDELRVGNSTLTLSAPPAGRRPAQDARVPVRRPPTRSAPPPQVRLSAPTRPRRPDRRTMPWIVILLPLVIGVGLAWWMKTMMFLAFALFSPVLMLAQHLSDKRDGRRSRGRDIDDYNKALQRHRERVARTLLAEHAIRIRALPGLSDAFRTIETLDRRLWHRHPAEYGYLHWRIGRGPIASGLTVVREGAEDERVPLPDAPVTVDLAAHRVVGVAGHDHRRAFESLLVQAVAWHSPAHLRIAVVSHRRLDETELGWLPHLRPVLDRPAALFDLDHPDALADFVRGLPVCSPDDRSQDPPSLLLILLDAEFTCAARALTEIIGDPKRYLCSVVAFGESETELPDRAHPIVRLHSSTRTTVLADDVTDCVPDLPATGLLDRSARLLAPAHDISSIDVNGTPPTQVGLDEVWRSHLGTDLLDIAALQSNWPRRPVMSALLGATASGPAVTDLVVDGPHALLAGTTGAGKSELLQTLIASLAAANRPDALNFVLIDYKGGAAFRECARLPHTVGLVTDLDGHLTERALVSLQAELQRRERLLAAASAKDLDDYHRDPSAPTIARLCLIIDEFRVLAEELPDFVDGLVRLATVGRSLGVHLVLATQRPAGIVSADIRANVNLRIALRVRDDGDSQDVIDTMDAARIPASSPGRGYLRCGGGESQLFQSARVTVPALRRDSISVGEFGRPTQHRGTEDESILTRLAPLLKDCAEHLRITASPPPWLPPLPDAVTRRTLDGRDSVTVCGAESAGYRFGLADRPHRQDQPAMVWSPPTDQHLAIVGGPRSGRSTAVRTLLAEALSQDDAPHVYVLDLGRSLADLGSHSRVGAVVSPDEPSRVERVLEYVTNEIADRRRHPERGRQRLILVIDGWDVLDDLADDAALFRLMDLATTILRDGSSADVHVLATGGRGLLTNRSLSLFRSQIALAMADKDDLAAIGVPRDCIPSDMPPGRGLTVPDGTELQITLPAELPACFVPTGIHRIDAVPTAVPVTDLAPSQGIAVGAGADGTVALPLGRLDDLVAIIAGPPRSGRTTTLLTVAEQLHGRPTCWISTDTRAELPDDVFQPEDGTQLAEWLARDPTGVLLIDDVCALVDSEIEESLARYAAKASSTGAVVVASGDIDQLSGNYRGLVGELRRRGTGVLLMPSRTDGELFALRCPKLDRPRPGNGFLVHRGELTELQVAQVAAPAPSRPDGPGDESSCTESG